MWLANAAVAALAATTAARAEVCTRYTMITEAY